MTQTDLDLWPRSPESGDDVVVPFTLDALDAAAASCGSAMRSTLS
jgi:hypothetical protein